MMRILHRKTDCHYKLIRVKTGFCLLSFRRNLALNIHLNAQRESLPFYTILICCKSSLHGGRMSHKRDGEGGKKQIQDAVSDYSSAPRVNCRHTVLKRKGKVHTKKIFQKTPDHLKALFYFLDHSFVLC